MSRDAAYRVTRSNNAAVIAVPSSEARTRSPIVEAVEVSRSFGPTVALAGVSLEVEAGQTHALLGPNGAGKTTLLRSLSGIILPSGGHVAITGINTAKN